MSLIPTLFIATLIICVLYILGIVLFKKLETEFAEVLTKVIFMIHLGTIIDYMIRDWPHIWAYNDLDVSNTLNQFLIHFKSISMAVFNPIYDHGFNALFYYIFLLFMVFAWYGAITHILYLVSPKFIKLKPDLL